MNGDRIIGNKGGLPWHLPSDLHRFRALTAGKPVIMGRRTFESILARNRKPLPDRCNVVVTRNIAPWKHRQSTHPEMFRNCVFVESLQQGIHLMNPSPEVFIIGGSQIYAQALSFADRMYFTQVQGKFEGDTTFPQFNPHQWRTVHDELIRTDNHPYAFSILERLDTGASLGSTSGTDLVNPTFAKSEGYGKTITEIIEAGICPFCPEHFLWHPWPILHRSGDWILTRSGWPYENAEHHFLIIGNKHLIADIDMSDADDHHVKGLTRWAIEQFGLKGWGKIARSGETSHTGATVQHLHYHLIQPKPGLDGKALPVNFPIG
ncbi:MAG: Dihydrofolate reductase [Candidatus Wolfebacteria bacterium GW2011_GWA2_47_9b]|nr:MAG: Dihydrofolate reductase [Candidatus Wolfebacteria bacterium GW2011_GWD2_47_17]KKU90597.1 MAG: Dihydrofolate reductase [Candidatus Wolfebacteria bacterium GW2011_GWA2_47_9b]